MSDEWRERLVGRGEGVRGRVGQRGDNLLNKLLRASLPHYFLASLPHYFLSFFFFLPHAGYGFGTNGLTADQKNQLIFGGLGLFFLLFLSGYALN